MKYIVAIIRPEKLDAVIEALSNVEVIRMSLSDCRGIGSLEKTAEIYRGSQYTVNYRTKVKIEIAVNEEFVKPTVDTIREICHTGKATDGIVFVLDLAAATNIGTGKTGSEAI